MCSRLQVAHVDELPLIKHFLPTFKATAQSPHIQYHLSLGYDEGALCYAMRSVCVLHARALCMYVCVCTYVCVSSGDKFYDNRANLDLLRRRIVEFNAGLGNSQLHFVKLSRDKLVGLWNQVGALMRVRRWRPTRNS